MFIFAISNFSSIPYFQENAALADEIVNIQEEIETKKVEREYLFNKLVHFEPQNDTSNGDVVVKREYKRKNSSSNSESLKPLKKKIKLQAMQQHQQIARKTPQQPQTKTVPSQIIDQWGGINVLSWGTANCSKNDFSVIPLGYKVVRNYKGRNYFCKIVDNGLPIFQIYPTDDVTNIFSGSSANEAFDEFINVCDPAGASASHDGNSFFGLTNKRIRDYIALLPHKIKEEPFFDPHNYTMSL